MARLMGPDPKEPAAPATRFPLQPRKVYWRSLDMGLIKMAAVSLAGYAIYKFAMRGKQSEPAHAGSGHYTDVRDAGPENMKATPEHWSKTDEAIDESFPARDPPATY